MIEGNASNRENRTIAFSDDSSGECVTVIDPIVPLISMTRL